MQNDEINISEFITERESDIRILEKAINSSRKKTMLFQRLSFYNRRRNRSNFVKKKKSTRQKHRHFLRTHVWYAKRFKMIKMGEVSLPLQRNLKSSKFIYKSQKRGFIFDESFKKIYKFNLQDPFLKEFSINFNLINLIQLVNTKDGFIEVVVTFSIVLFIIPIWNKFSFAGIKELRSCISLLKMEDNMIQHFSMDIEGSIRKNDIFYIKNVNDYESGKIFLDSKEVMNFWNEFIKKGCIPICIEELQRLALENDYMIFPFDDVNSSSFKLFEDTENSKFIEKYEKTPKSKNVSIDYENLSIATKKKCHFYIFELEKGVLKKNGFIFFNEKIIGRVIRGWFCFTKGKSGGICYTFEEVDFSFFYECKNYDHTNVYKLKFTKKL